MPRLIQPSFSRGELAPELTGRVDTAASRVGLRTAYNAVVHSYGGVSNRAGLMFVGPCMHHSGTPPEIIPFQYNTEDTYVLEFGHEKMRVIRNDAHVLNAAKTISGATQASPVVVTATAHGFSSGDDVYIIGVVGMTELNARWFKVQNVTADTVELTNQVTGANVDGTSYGAYVSGGSVSSVYQLTTPYDLEDLAELKYTQSANVMTLTHRKYDPRELTRTDHDAWTLNTISFEPTQDDPTDIAVVVNTAGPDTYRYKVTAINAETGEESLAGVNTGSISISAASATNPVTITATGHGLAFLDEVEISGFSQMTEVNGRRFFVTGVTANTFNLQGENGTSYAAETSGGLARLTHVEAASAAANPDNRISWASAAGARKYAVYRQKNGIYGFIGESETREFTDANIAPDTTLGPPEARNPFIGDNNRPGVVNYYEQRRIFGSTFNNPDTNYYSVTGSAANMSFSSPRQADDAITTTLAALQVNEIRSYVPLTDLLIFTSGAEWRVNAGTEAAFSAETLRQKPQSYWGSALYDPLVVGDVVLFVTRNKTYIRSLGYEITIDKYRGNDMTAYSPHLFKHHTIVGWSYSTFPDPLVLVVRSDGLLCPMTFNPEQEVVGWTRWETEGKFLRTTATYPSANSIDVAGYFIIQRKLGSSNAYYIERTASRRFKDVRDCFFVDSGLSYDPKQEVTNVVSSNPVLVNIPNNGYSNGDEVDFSDIVWEPSYDDVYTKTQPDQLNNKRYFVAAHAGNTFRIIKTTGRLDITNATQANPVVVTAEGHGLANDARIGIFNVEGMTELNGNVYRVRGVTTNTFELRDLSTADNIDGTAFTAYTFGGQAYPGEDGSSFSAYVEGGYGRLAVDTFAGAWHLEGAEIVMLADGNVITGQTVTDFKVGPLDRKYSRAHIGRRYVTDIEPLNPETSRGTLQGLKLSVPFSTIRVSESRGILVGPDANNLREIKQREFEDYGQPTALKTGDIELSLERLWDGGGRTLFRQIYPLPFTLLANIPQVDRGSDEE